MQDPQQTGGGLPAADGPRVLRPLDHAGWRFREGRVAPSRPGDAPVGEAVSLPHCWNAAEEYRPGILPRRGWATYQLDLELPPLEPNREWRLRCGGFYGRGRAWVNGRPAGDFNGDYLGFDLDVTAAAQAGANCFVLQVSNAYSRNVLPGIPDPDFHLYGGLGGGMHLANLPRVRLVRDECRVASDPVCPGEITVEIGAVNRSVAPAVRSVHVVIRDPAGREVAAPAPVEITLTPGETVRREIRCVIQSPELWRLETPVLYSIAAELQEQGQTRDRLEWTFGLRTLEFHPRQGFRLNGQQVELRGVNRHENLPGFGFALPLALHADDARQIKELGFNFVRLSHYPQAPEFLAACDRLGLLVYAELCSWKRIAGGGWLAAAENQLARMIRRDRHHPAVILWGLGNEGRDRRVYLRLKALARELDPSRPVIYAENHAYRARRKKTAGLTDVWGLNYEFDALDFARQAAPTGCVVVTECANLPYARRGHWPAEAQQTALVREALRHVEQAGHGVVGWTLWSFADYATPRRQRWFRECGVVDGWRSAKMAADWIRARHRPEPFLSIRGDWTRAAGLRRRLYLVTNCPQVHLLRTNGAREVIATPRPDLYEVDVDFDGAPLRFEGRHGNGTVEAVLVPWDVPAAFILRAAPVPTAAGTVPLFRCELQVVDAQGAAVGGYEGDAVVRLPVGVRASLVGGDRLPVHAGQAAFYVELPPGAAELKVECALDDFVTQTLGLPPERSAP